MISIGTKLIEYPSCLYCGKDIYVIEPEDVTGNPDAVYQNKITAIGIFDVYGIGLTYHYVWGGCPEYFAGFDKIGKTIFFTREEAEEALKKGRYIKG